MARVVSHVDGRYMGDLQVELLNDVGRDMNRSGSIITVSYLSPFYGVTNVLHNSENNDYNGTQKSYGFWMIPPDPGTLVMVIFVNGVASKGYWIGCVQDDYMNFMVPGLAATELSTQPGKGRQVVAEYNKKKNKLEHADQTMVAKPPHPFQKVLETQGLAKDDIRGITTSSARREFPSMVFGISTPGPIDRKAGAPTGKVGKSESKINDAFVSRLGGTTFVMDDGDDNFLRKTHPKDGPPVYASVENGENGMPDIPHNELVRIRTRTGHQILLHNSEDLIYIGNSRGTAWIELTSNGKIDIYAEDSVSIHTKKDFNFFAGNDVNIEATNNINIKAGANLNVETGSAYNLAVGTDNKILIKGNQSTTVNGTCQIKTGAFSQTISGAYNLTAGNTAITAGSLDINASGATKITGSSTDISGGSKVNITAGRIDFNGPTPAATASRNTPGEAPPTPEPIPTGEDGIVQRKPDHEPWAGHENLHNSGLKYTTATDTFKKIGK